jgi:hypothetical protein
VFNDTYTLTASGYIQSSPGDLYIFTNGTTTAGNFINLSTNKTQYDTFTAKFLFHNTLGLTQEFTVAGHDFRPPTSIATNATAALSMDLTEFAGFSNNFALGTLEISDFSTVRVSDAFLGVPGLGTNDNLMAGLYLQNLFMGQNSLLIISTNVQVYFINSNNWTSANFVLEDNVGYDNSLNGLHQLLVIPEPAIVLLWLSGAITVYAARKRSLSRR